MESSRPRSLGQPRVKRRLGAVIALVGIAMLWSLGLLGTGDAYAIVWTATGLLTCLGGLAVAIGRARAYRGDTWQVVLVAAFASLLGPLGVVLLLLPSVRRSLREVPSQLGARGEAAPLVHTPEQAAAEHSRGVSLALGIAAASLAFWSSAAVGVWLGLAGGTTDGDWFALGLIVTFIVGTVAFVGLLVVRRRRRVLARLEQAAAAGMLAAIIFVALDGGDLHWSDGTQASVGFLYWLSALVTILFVFGAAMARTSTRN